MRALLESVVEELRDLKHAGVERVRITQATLEHLEQVVRCASQEQAPARAEAPSPMEAPAPEPALKQPQKKAPVRVSVDHGVEIAPIPEPPVITLPEGDKASRYAWLRERVLNCPVCNAHVKPGKKIVIGSGDLDAKIFFCGEAPGAEEETQGEVFVGAAGQLLDKIIMAMGLKRDRVYIGNIMNWRPEVKVGNRPPTQEEMAFCLPYLRAQLEIVQPEVIVALGKTAVDGLLGADSDRRMGKIRGQWQRYEGNPLMITYHPSYLLHNNTNRTKRMVWEDMLLVMERVGLPISEKQRGYFQ